MILRALTISSLVIDDLRRASPGGTGRPSGSSAAGTVHSVFARALNIIFAEDALMSIHPEGYPLHPYAVTVSGWSGPGVPAAPHPGESVALGPQGLHIGTGRLKVRFSGAHVWDPRPRIPTGTRGGFPADPVGPLAAYLARLEIKSPFLRALGYGGAAETPAGTDALLLEKCRAVSDGLKASWLQSDPRGAARAMRKAVGLGPGLTPSGDDFLVGFLAGVHFAALRGDAGARGLAGRLEEAVGLTRSMTPLISFFMLRGALSGFVPQPLSDVLAAAAAGDRAGVLQSAGRLMKTGATSGGDMLAGLICWFEADRIGADGR
jgi:hypothetical protein